MFISPLRTTHGNARRIISLVPSQTELLYDLGAGDYVIGITKFCIHPTAWRKEKKIIGGTKNLHIDNILALKPDLIIANKEENVKEQVEMLATHCPVWLTDVNSLKDAQQMIKDIGSLTGFESKAQEYSLAIEKAFAQLIPSDSPIPTAYLIWQDPYMTVGGDTYINAMMTNAGFLNVFEKERRYPECTIEQLRQSGCCLVLLSSEPYPFKEKHKAHIAAALPGMTVLLADGEMFSWYGSRLLKAPGYFQQLHEQISPLLRTSQ
jgi:ABC-type Fe3+-hydroxamate transport system substrate-binding protein